MQKSARRTALDLLNAVINDGKFANLALKNELNSTELSARDKAFVTELVYGTLDKLITVDYVISLYTNGRVNGKIRNILRMGVYQIMFLNVPDRASCNESVNLACEIGKSALKGFVNGVLRAVSREKNNIVYPADEIANLSVRFSYPEFLVRELLSTLGNERTEHFLAYQAPRTTTLRISDKKQCAELLEQSSPGVYFENAVQIKGELSSTLFASGACSPQSESSMAAVHALGVQSGERILDCCAAPGGKTVYIAQIMRKGEVVALDKHAHRVELIKSNASRCHVQDIVHAYCADITTASELGMFDRVLVDAPCSGLGVSKPEIKNGITPNGLKELEALQKQILKEASQYCRPNGTLVYSTCTIRNNENIGQIKAFLNENPNFELESMAGLIGEKFEAAFDVTKGCIQLYQDTARTDGFFIARFIRRV